MGHDHPRRLLERARAHAHEVEPDARAARFEVLDVAGRIVHREQLAAAAGPRELVWDLRTDAGARARPGLYLVRVRAGSFEKATRVVVSE